MRPCTRGWTALQATGSTSPACTWPAVKFFRLVNSRLGFGACELHSGAPPVGYYEVSESEFEFLTRPPE